VTRSDLLEHRGFSDKPDDPADARSGVLSVRLTRETHLTQGISVRCTAGDGKISLALDTRRIAML
jgi:hypothetical protein